MNHLSPPTKGEVKASSKHNLKPSLNACLNESKGTPERAYTVNGVPVPAQANVGSFHPPGDGVAEESKYIVRL